MDNQNEKPKKSLAKTLGLIALLVAIFAIPLAVFFDVVSFAEVILQFIASLIVPVIAFVFLFFCMLVSIVLIFGVYLLDEYGFWPLTLSIQFFKEILGDITVSSEAISRFTAFRYVLIVICAVVFVLAVVTKILARKDKANGNMKAYRSAKGTSTAAIVLSILGILVSVGALAIVSNI